MCAQINEKIQWQMKCKTRRQKEWLDTKYSKSAAVYQVIEAQNPCRRCRGRTGCHEQQSTYDPQATCKQVKWNSPTFGWHQVTSLPQALGHLVPHQCAEAHKTASNNAERGKSDTTFMFWSVSAWWVRIQPQQSLTDSNARDTLQKRASLSVQHFTVRSVVPFCPIRLLC